MKIILNIGLNVSRNYLPEGVEEMQFKYEHVKDCLARTLGKPDWIGLAESMTEKTVVVQYSSVEAVIRHVYWIARDLNQDCIAYSVQDDDDTVLGGALVGAYAHEWNHGIFDMKYFVLPSHADGKLNPELTLKV